MEETVGFFLRRGSFGTFLSPRREKYTRAARKQGERRRDPAKEPLPPPPYGERKNGGRHTKSHRPSDGGFSCLSFYAYKNQLFLFWKHSLQ